MYAPMRSTIGGIMVRSTCQMPILCDHRLVQKNTWKQVKLVRVWIEFKSASFILYSKKNSVFFFFFFIIIWGGIPSLIYAQYFQFTAPFSLVSCFVCRKEKRNNKWSLIARYIDRFRFIICVLWKQEFTRFTHFAAICCYKIRIIEEPPS